MKNVIVKAIACVSAIVLLMAVGCNLKGDKVKAYASMDGHRFFPEPYTIHVDKQGTILFAQFSDGPDIAYPVYEVPWKDVPYQYYFVVEDGEKKVMYCFNY